MANRVARLIIEETGERTVKVRVECEPEGDGGESLCGELAMKAFDLVRSLAAGEVTLGTAAWLRKDVDQMDQVDTVDQMDSPASSDYAGAAFSGKSREENA